MEKNGAITSNTPSCAGNCDCNCVNSCKCSTKTAETQSNSKQLLLFPETKEVADNLDQDLIKQAIEVVKASSTSPR
jgi:NurA-like 5'-3' nuclease